MELFLSSTLRFYIIVLICQSCYSLYYVLYRRKEKTNSSRKRLLTSPVSNMFWQLFYWIVLHNIYIILLYRTTLHLLPFLAVFEKRFLLYFILFFCLLIYFPQNSWFLFHFYIHSFFNNLTAYFKEMHSFMWF